MHSFSINANKQNIQTASKLLILLLNVICYYWLLCVFAEKQDLWSFAWYQEQSVKTILVKRISKQDLSVDDILKRKNLSKESRKHFRSSDFFYPWTFRNI